MADRTLTVKILGDSTSLRREFDRSTRSAKEFNREIGRASTGSQAARGALSVTGGKGGFLFGSSAFIASAVGTAAVASSIKAASNLNEQVNKSQVVFRQSGAEIKRWSQTTAESFGISQRAALEAASSFGQILETSGLTERRAAVMSRSLVELASDLASFNNIDPQEALDKLRSGLAGEAEPLRRVGVLLSETRVQQEAYRSGIAKVGAKLTEGQKVQARYNLILQDTKTAQGDFARTSDSLANKQRILSARVEELQARLGQDLLPVVSGSIGVFLKAEAAVRKYGDALQKLGFLGGQFKAFGLFPKSGVSTDVINELKRQSNLLDAAARGGATGPGFTLDKELDKAEKAAPRKISAELRNRIFDQAIARSLDRVQDVKTLQGQIAALQKISDVISRRIAVTKDITRKLNLEDEVVDIRRRQQALRQQIALNAIEARRLAEEKRQDQIEAAREKAREAREAAQAAAQRRLAATRARQFRALGLTSEGDERVASVRQLRNRLGTLTDQLSGTFLDTRKTSSVLSRVRKVLSGGLGAVGRDVRQKIQEIFADLDRQLRQHETTTATRFHKANANALLANLGLSPDQVRALRSRLSQVGAGGTVHAAGAGAFGVPIVVEHTTTLDGRVIERSTTKHQQKRRRRNPPQKRGVVSP